jgi:hypothetical protein
MPPLWLLGDCNCYFMCESLVRWQPFIALKSKKESMSWPYFRHVHFRCFSTSILFLKILEDGDSKNILWAYKQTMGRDSVVGVATCYGLDGPGTESRWGRDFPQQSRPDLGRHLAPYTKGIWLFSVIRRPGCGVNYPAPI